MKFRIVKRIIHFSNPRDEDIKYYVQRKNLFRWKDIKRTEISDHELSFNTYSEAEIYLKLNVSGYYCDQIDSYYTFKNITYWL